MREVPASVGQRLLWLMEHYQGEHNSLVQQVLWRLEPGEGRARLHDTLGALTERHESLRTRLVGRGRALAQIVDAPRVPPLEVVRVRCREELGAALAADLHQRIDVSRWPVRATLFDDPAGPPLLCLSLHHLITDHWSNALVSRDLRAIHAGATDLPPVGWQYADWSQWQHENLTGESLEKLRAYWRSNLEGASLPMLPRRDDPDPSAGGFVNAKLPPESVQALTALAKSLRSGLFPVMLAVFYALLHKHTGQCDLTIPSLFANRARLEVHQTAGFFVNMVALRTRVEPTAPFTDLVRSVRTTTIQALRYQHLPYQMLPPTIRPAGGRPDEVVFQLLDPQQSRADMQGEELAELMPHVKNNRFALELLLVPIQGSLTALLRYRRHVFDEPGANRFLNDYVELTRQFADQPDRTVHEACRSLVSYSRSS
jgi:hypothetical protein